MTTDLDHLRTRIAELESRDMRFAPYSVRRAWLFDLTAMRELLALREKGANDAGRI